MRHILGLSGGKDSTALALYMRKKYSELPLEYVFCDTGKELPETYDYLLKIQAVLDIRVIYLNAGRGFDSWLEVYNNFLPSPGSRWCTKQLKIVPLEEYIGGDEALSYIGLRADEDRAGYKQNVAGNIQAVYPFKEAGVTKADVFQMLEESGLGLPKYYEWRSRSGCSFCFFQRKIEWVGLAEKHPELFEQAKQYEKEMPNGKRYTWNDGESLDEIQARKDEIIQEHRAALQKRIDRGKPAPLLQLIEETLDEEMDAEGICLACHL